GENKQQGTSVEPKSITRNLASQAPVDNIESPIFLEAPTDFREESFSKEELVDEPILDLGRQFQLSQNGIDIGKESWEMHEFLKPTVKDLGEEREMLVDEEYDANQDCYSYVPVGTEELASSIEMDLEAARHWRTEPELTKMPELSPARGFSPEEAEENSSVCPGTSTEYCQPNTILDGYEMRIQNGHKDLFCIDDDLEILERSKQKSEDCDLSSSQDSALSKARLSSELPEREEGEGEETPVFSHWGPPQTVEIFRDPHVPLGISIVGGHTVIKRLKNGEELKGIFIKQVLKDSPAGRTNALKTGDKILEVSGTDVQNATHEEAVEAIKNAGNPIVFVIQSLSALPRMVSIVNPKKDKDRKTQDTAGEAEQKESGVPPPMKLPPPYKGPRKSSTEETEEEEEEGDDTYTEGKLCDD
ncbi:hypothetical protein lerEdw1_011696, partial [Lerista edwardsae]